MRFVLHTLAATTLLSAPALPSTTAASQGGAAAPGDKRLTFEAPDENGRLWRSRDVAAKFLVLVFYPADFTGGCTAQACGFRDDYQALVAQGAVVVGVSGDAVKTHAAFKKKHQLPYTLLSDADGKLADLFKIPYSKTAGKVVVDGEVFDRQLTAQRYTVVLNAGGQVIARYPVKDAKGDSKKLLDLLKTLPQK